MAHLERITPRRGLLIIPVALVVLLAAACQDVQTTRAVDGDTIDTTAGRVRVLGIDTPERGEPCYQAAKDRVQQLTVGGQVETIHNSVREDRDRYGRLLRHVMVRGAGDLGEILLREGLANARYDSLDGYNRHQFQDRYRELDRRTPHRCGSAMDAVS